VETAFGNDGTVGNGLIMAGERAGQVSSTSTQSAFDRQHTAGAENERIRSFQNEILKAEVNEPRMQNNAFAAAQARRVQEAEDIDRSRVEEADQLDSIRLSEGLAHMSRSQESNRVQSKAPVSDYSTNKAFATDYSSNVSKERQAKIAEANVGFQRNVGANLLESRRWQAQNIEGPPMVAMQTPTPTFISLVPDPNSQIAKALRFVQEAGYTTSPSARSVTMDSPFQTTGRTTLYLLRPLDHHL